MKTHVTKLVVSALCLFATIGVFAQGTAFTYQGRLNTGGSPANGSYDFVFFLDNASTGGSALGGTITLPGVAVTNGLFSVQLDFGPGIFTGQSCWLDIFVRTNGAGSLTEMSTRQPLTPTPYAIYAENAGGVASASISAPQLNTIGAPATGQVLEFNGTSLQWTAPSGGGSAWSLTGNDGAGDILGTTNNHPLYLVADGFSAGTFWPFANGSVSVALGPKNYFSTSGNGGNFVAGGGSSPNLINADNSSIGGGYGNYIDYNSPGSVIAGGYSQQIGTFSGPSVIGGGAYNTISNSVTAGVIPGGLNNVVAGNYGFAAGSGAQALNMGAFVWADDSASAPFASTANNQFSVRAYGGVRFVTGGAGLTIDGVAVSTGGGSGSNANLTISMIQTTNSGLDSSAIGYQNAASGNYATVAGGTGNTANNNGDAVGGGSGNTASGIYDTISGGDGNAANAELSTVSGGGNNAATGAFSTVSGGYQNTASGSYSTVAGGDNNYAVGDFSFAAGSQAVANNSGAFVWADDSGGSFTSTANNQFSVRADGGVRFVTGGNGLSGLTLDGYQVLTTATGGGSGGGTNGWSLSGNGGTASGVNFLGTTDSADLVFKTHNKEGLRLTTSQDLILQRPSEYSDFSERNGLSVYGFTDAADTGSRIFANQNVLGPVL
ncbi:MAG: hypothetical protein ABSH48_28465, partial [Verrucomicrobiota bacterium]